MFIIEAQLWESLLGGSWDLVTRVISKVTLLITSIRVLITLLTKSHDPPSSIGDSCVSLREPRDWPRCRRFTAEAKAAAASRAGAPRGSLGKC